MQPVEDLLREALRNGDEQGRAQVRGRHLPDDLMADLAEQTHLYALEHAADPTPDGWLVFRDGIGSWWCHAAGLTDEQFRRLYMLRADVVKRLTERAWPIVESPRYAALCTARLSDRSGLARR